MKNYLQNTIKSLQTKFLRNILEPAKESLAKMSLHSKCLGPKCHSGQSVILAKVSFSQKETRQLDLLLKRNSKYLLQYVQQLFQHRTGKRKGDPKGVDKTHLVCVPPPQLLLQGPHGLKTQSTRNLKLCKIYKSQVVQGNLAKKKNKRWALNTHVVNNHLNDLYVLFNKAVGIFDSPKPVLSRDSLYIISFKIIHTRNSF